MLYITLILIIVILILEKLIKNKTEKKEEKQEINLQGFEKKEYLLTQEELKFYKILKQITDEMEINLFCQVAMYELINTRNYKDFNKIKNKTIDFVITEKNCRIKLCIELDDETHNQKQRIERDKIVNEIFKIANTKLIRIKRQNYYKIEEIKKIISDSL